MKPWKIKPVVKLGPPQVSAWATMKISDAGSRATRQGMTPLTFHWRAEPSDVGLSLVEYLARQLQVAPAQAADLIDFGSVQIQGRQERDPARLLASDQEVTVHVPWLGVRRHYEIQPQRILYQDRFLLAYNKEPGIPSQQTPADAYNNLHAAIIRFLQGSNRHPYVALHHRLDRETSGVLVFALDRAVNGKLGTAFEQREVTKDYLAWIKGCPREESWVVAQDIGRRAGRYVACPTSTGKPAETVFRVLSRENDRSLVWACPRTGRTHQIRLHLQWCGHPVIGDRLYGGPPAPRLYLHAYRLQLKHPRTEAALHLVAPVPAEWPGRNSLPVDLLTPLVL
jgi:23S rRNA pseudouridine1911/1915/1917 synthase